MAAGAQDLSELEKDPRLFLYTSLTAGSSHIITATSRLETILKANKIPFLAIDTATDEKARRLWQRRAGKRKIPGLVKEGFVLGDLEEVEEWNEFGELHENIGPVPPAGPTASAQNQNVKPKVSPAPPLPINPTATGGTAKISPAKPLLDESKMRPLPGAAEIKARNDPLPESSPEDAVKPETMTSAPAEKERSVNAAKAALSTTGSSKVDHLSAPPSAIQSGTQTPAEPTKEGADVPSTAEEGAPAASEDAAASTEDSQVPFSPAIADSAESAGKRKSETHRGSDVVALPSDEIKKVESENAITEHADEEGDEVTKKVEGLQVGDGKDVHEQNAKEPEDAGKSVED